MSPEGAYKTRSGPVRVSGYAIKIRRVINRVLREYYSMDRLSSKLINQSISELNSKLYSVIVEKYNIPKEAVVNIAIEFSVTDNKIYVNNTGVGVFDKDGILSKNVTTAIKNMIS